MGLHVVDHRVSGFRICTGRGRIKVQHGIDNGAGCRFRVAHDITYRVRKLVEEWLDLGVHVGHLYVQEEMRVARLATLRVDIIAYEFCERGLIAGKAHFLCLRERGVAAEVIFSRDMHYCESARSFSGRAMYKERAR